MLFGNELNFKTVADAEQCWDSICDSIEEVQYSTSTRGLYKKRRAVTKLAQQFMSRCSRIAASMKRKGDKDADKMTALAQDARTEYDKMVEYKEKVREALDNVY